MARLFCKLLGISILDSILRTLRLGTSALTQMRVPPLDHFYHFQQHFRVSRAQGPRRARIQPQRAALRLQSPIPPLCMNSVAAAMTHPCWSTAGNRNLKPKSDHQGLFPMPPQVRTGLPVKEALTQVGTTASTTIITG